MEYSILGDTGIKVSKLCFGSLTISPLQVDLGIKKGANIIKYAYENGINFIDTAELYSNYSQIKASLIDIERSKIVIATKSYAYSKETAEKSLVKALKQIGTNYVDLFLLHEQESENTIRGHMDAIEFFVKAKKKGLIRAFGISTHRIEGVISACKYDDIEVIHPIINQKGIGIQDGNVEEMICAIKLAYESGKGIYGMKPLGGGHLINNAEQSLRYVRKIPYLHSIAIGMQSEDEIIANVSLVNKGHINIKIQEKLNQKVRKLHIGNWCQGCGQCVDACTHGGIRLENNKAVAVQDKCVFCGYCATKCPQFCIKVI